MKTNRDLLVSLLAQNPDTPPEELATRILAMIDQHQRREIAALGSPFMALTTLLQYAQWTISDESPGHHPTMPSAVAAAKGALLALSRGFLGQELDTSVAAPSVSLMLRSEDERKDAATFLVRAMLIAGFAKDRIRVTDPVTVNPFVAVPIDGPEALLGGLVEVYDAVFGIEPNSEPDVYADYDELVRLGRLLDDCITMVRASLSAGDVKAADSVTEQKIG